MQRKIQELIRLERELLNMEKALAESASMLLYLFLSQSSAIAGKKIKRSRRIACQMDGMKAQSDCSKGIWMRVGLKKMISITLVIRTAFALMLSTVLSDAL